MKHSSILEICLDPGQGGLELYFHRCGPMLRNRGYSVITVRSQNTFLAKQLSNPTTDDLLFPRLNNLLRWTHAFRIAGIIRNRNIQVIHAHHRKDILVVVLAKLFSFRKVRMFFTRQMPLPHFKHDPYHRWLYGQFSGIITITEKLKQDVIEKIPIKPELVQRLYYGVPAPTPVTQQERIDFLSISSNTDINIGVFSRLEFQKGQHLVLEALQILAAKGHHPKLYIAGNVSEKDYEKDLKQRIVTYQLEKQVVFKGFLKEPQKAMQCLDIYILPSRHEAFGLVLAEAMRCGVVVMGVNAGGVPEIIDHEQTGLLFDWDNPTQLAEQIEFLIKNPEERKKLALRGKEKADRDFEESIHFDKLGKILTPHQLSNNH